MAKIPPYYGGPPLRCPKPSLKPDSSSGALHPVGLESGHGQREHIILFGGDLDEIPDTRNQNWRLEAESP